MKRVDMDQEIKERLINLTVDLMLIPSSATRPNDIERCFAFVKNYLGSLESVDIKEYRHNGFPSLVALPKGVVKPEVLLVSHLDVVDHSDIGAYNPKTTNGRIYGPGSGDMKGAMSIMMELFKNFMRSYSDASLGLAITSDEEQGGESGIGFLFQEAGLRCKVAINPDGGGLNEITKAEKGVLHLHLSRKGHSSHAARPWLGENALELLMERVSHLKTYFERFKDGDDYWYPTCSLTVIKSSNTTVNRIPCEAEAFLDIRFPSPFTADEVMDKVTEILGTDIGIDVLVAAESLEFNPDEDFEKAIEDVTGKTANYVREDGASDSRFISKYGIPVVISRPIVGEIHSDNEWIDIESMVKFYRICETYLKRKLL